MKEKYIKSIDKHGFVGSTYYATYNEMSDLDKEALYQYFDFLDLKHMESQLLSQEDPLLQVLSALKTNE